MARYAVGVKEFVDFACRRGDLSSGFADDDVAGGPSAQEGARAHRKIQKQAGEEWESEVAVDWTVGGIGDSGTPDDLRLRGRIDLLRPRSAAEQPSVIEIKSSYFPPASLPQSSRDLHWAQAKVYAYCWLSMGEETDDATIDVRVCTADLRSDVQHTETQEWSLAALREWITPFVAIYLRWMRLIAANHARMIATAKSFSFPYAEMRQQQRQFAEAVFRTIAEGGQLMIEAPTGTGKTMSAMFPAIKAMSSGHCDKVAYLTAKTPGRAVALQALADCQEAGLHCSALEIRSRATACPCRVVEDDAKPKEQCEFVQGFFDRLPAAREQALAAGVLSADVIQEIASQHSLCPFSLGIQMLPWVQVVIADYNYVFDPLVSLQYFRETQNRVVALVDEAHNMPDRGSGMFSAELSLTTAQRVAAACKGDLPAMYTAATAVVKQLQMLLGSGGQAGLFGDSDDPDVGLAAAVGQAIEAANASGGDGEPRLPANAYEWLLDLFRYVKIEQLYSDQHTVWVDRDTMTYKLWCVDAAPSLKIAGQRLRARIDFSATLRPSRYYQDALGLESDCYRLSLPPSFEPTHQCVITVPLDTRRKARDRTLLDIVASIETVFAARGGNYIVYCPSYAYMDQIACVVRERNPQWSITQQERGSSAHDRLAFVEAFSRQDHLLAFAIAGGIYGEGIDLIGDKLVGTIIVGLGLPAFDEQHAFMRAYYDAAGVDGYAYTYTYPAFTRVQQAAGRVIRSPSDRGVVVLIDQRYNYGEYVALYPEDWNLQNARTTAELEGILQQFWLEA